MKSNISPLALLILIATLVLAGPLIVQGQTAPPTGQRLRALAGNLPIGFAAESDFWNLPDTVQYQQTASSEFSMLTPGNQLKWDTTEPQQNTFNFAPGDMHGQFAQQHNMVFHGHTLLWHSQLPGWLTGGSWTAATLTAVLQNHIDKVVGHFKGKIAIWDVVNEAFNDDGTRRASMWQNIIGQPYIEIAFQRARTADPNAVLVYNDFNIETLNAKSDAVFAMVRDFQSRGIPIDAIGMQTHPHRRWFGLRKPGIQYAALRQSRIEDLYFRDGCARDRSCNRSRPSEPGHRLPECSRPLPVAAGLQRVHRMGFHRQIFLDTLNLPRPGRRSAVRSKLQPEAGLLRVTSSIGSAQPWNADREHQQPGQQCDLHCARQYPY
ncbi:MAG TPA: endo-1,4-beta-xylanase [Candidatus Angelobacter sp.]|nr:endo-1,4-beta-xylanase [Candidatus Angelobacter sp.]